MQVRAREEAALIAAQTEADKYGNGVTAEAQDIFFALSKTCAPLQSRGRAWRIDFCVLTLLCVASSLFLLDQGPLRTAHSHGCSLPCRWDGDVILVDDIRISKPYTPQQCRGGTPQSLPRVQKIVRWMCGS